MTRRLVQVYESTREFDNHVTVSPLQYLLSPLIGLRLASLALFNCGDIHIEPQVNLGQNPLRILKLLKTYGNGEH